ncbi:hypothetical protein VQ643_03265 [Pseudomonas sp. F1_0610]|uniref:pilus assembly PilX family protein n=1 Tax=Pseudomonas sp. F1_0610 TaxID=3114284 RepID=UPI0039C2E261
MNYYLLNKQKGSTLIIGLVFLVIMMLAAATGLKFANFEESMSGHAQTKNYIFQQAQSELAFRLNSFNSSAKERDFLFEALQQPVDTDIEILKTLPGTSRAQVEIKNKSGLKDIRETKLRFVKDTSCGDGSSLDRFVCIDYELETKAVTESKVSSNQFQGLTFQNNIKN